MSAANGTKKTLLVVRGIEGYEILACNLLFAVETCGTFQFRETRLAELLVVLDVVCSRKRLFCSLLLPLTACCTRLALAHSSAFPLAFLLLFPPPVLSPNDFLN